MSPNIENLIKTGEIELDKEKRRYICTKHPQRSDFGCDACYAALKATGEYYGTARDGGFK